MSYFPAMDLKNRPDLPGNQALIETVGKAASESGFLILTNHGIQQGLSDRCFSMCQEFFDLQSEAKIKFATQRFLPSNSNSYRGYFPVIAGDPSQKEGFEFGQCSSPDSRFPETLRWPEIQGFEATLKKMHAELTRLGLYMLSLLGLYLGHRQDWMQKDFADGMSTFRIIHYPGNTQSQSFQSPNELTYSTPDHTDSGFITLLFQDNTGGLEALFPDGQWREVPPTEGAIVMNLGDLLAFLSGHRLKATRHRVRTPSGSRLSMPFFFEPSPGTLIPWPYKGGAISGSYREGELVPYADFLEKKIQSFGEYSVGSSRKDH
ncbi:MAG TPA: hypothetical protein DEA96_00145 [Leptospiraceae bacterium]|nr:hypothetical protein [Spirochaetaceae bacterium]HBS03341.1 hypothetical protein [Leptospiraceae bacterium]|tara:strand:- start:114126 stop:115082 length:957 start_codon:yes stop_codon:yes gene_type:complete